MTAISEFCRPYLSVLGAYKITEDNEDSSSVHGPREGEDKTLDSKSELEDKVLSDGTGNAMPEQGQPREEAETVKSGETEIMPPKNSEANGAGCLGRSLSASFLVLSAVLYGSVRLL